MALAGFTASCAMEGEIGSAEEALTYIQVLEAEDATGAGSSMPEIGASDDAYHRNTVPYTTATLSFTTTGAIQNGVVRARRGNTLCTPYLTLRIDGVDVGTHYVSNTAWADFPFGASFGAGNHTLSIYYRSGLANCALDVDEVSLTIFEADPPPPTTSTSLEAELATGAGAVESDVSASAGQLRSFTAGTTSATLAFTLPDPLVSAVVRVRGGSCGPLGRVRIDGVDVWSGTVWNTTWMEFPITASWVGAGAHEIEFHARHARTSCPLRYDVVHVETAPPPPPPVTTIFEAEDATGGGFVETDASASSGELLTFDTSLTSASMTVTTTGALLGGSVRLRGGGSCTPFGSVLVDGAVVWTGYASQATWTDVPFSATGFPAGPHTITFNARSARTICPLRFDNTTWVTSAP
jgi:hypothetical protein